VVVGWGSAGEDAHDLAGQVLAQLQERGHTVAVAESLTGGLVAAALTDIPGASASFRGAVVAYATELKAALLGVDRGMLARHGAYTRRWPRPWPRGSGPVSARPTAWRLPGWRGRNPRTGSRWARHISP